MSHQTPHDLLERYETSDKNGIVKARHQAEGKLAASYFDGIPRGQGNTSPDEFQTQFDPRTPGDKNVPISTTDDDTMGTWLERALSYYAEQVSNNRLNSDREGRLIHLYNARDRSSYYSTLFSTARGVMNQST